MKKAYDGIHIKYPNEISYEHKVAEVNRGKVPVGFVAHIERIGKKTELSKDLYAAFTDTFQEKITDLTKVNIFSRVLLSIIVAPLTVPLLVIMYFVAEWAGAPDFVNLETVLITIAIAIVIFNIVYTKRAQNATARTAARIEALSNGKYAVYEVEVMRKLWRDGHAVKEGCDSYYLDCNGAVIEVSIDEYRRINDTAKEVTILFLFCQNITEMILLEPSSKDLYFLPGIL